MSASSVRGVQSSLVNRIFTECEARMLHHRQRADKSRAHPISFCADVIDSFGLQVFRAVASSRGG